MNKMVKIQGILLIIVLILNMMFPLLSIATEDIVTITFEDENLYDTIMSELSNKIENHEDDKLTIQMTQENIDSVISLSLSDNISNIEGIEYFSNLESFYVSNYIGNDDDIIDLTPLSNLTELKKLSINYVTIRDINVLQNLSNLTSLTLKRTAINSAPISENGFKDITVLRNSSLTSLNIQGYDIGNNQENAETLSKLQNLTRLSLCGCNISDDDLEFISELTGLEELYLGGPNYEGNNIENIEPLRKMTNLKSLNLSNNKISDITSLYELTNLREVALHYNNITDITSLKGLVNLYELEIYHNNISDISPLSELTNLKYLYLGDNNIENIESLAKLNNLYVLDLYGNNITDVSSLSSITSLLPDGGLVKGLNLSYNHIRDASILDNELREVKIEGRYYDYGGIIKGQSIDINVEDKNVELPLIFLQTKDEKSRLYTEEDYVLVNCTLSSDGQSVIIDDGAEKASVKISGGEASGTVLNISTIDENPPILNISYSTTEMTNETVLVSIKSDEKIQPVEGWTLSEDELVLTKTYAKNMQEEVNVYDLAGNESKACISVSNIDTDAPQAEINYSTTQPTNNNVIVRIIANEKIQTVEGWTLSNDQTTLEKVFIDNGAEEVTLYDLVGNKRIIPIEVENIDRTTPVIQVKYSTKELTNENVEVQIKTNESIKDVDGWTLSSDKTTLIKEFQENTTEEVTVSDLAGNNIIQKLSISNIDKISPELSMSYSEIGETDGKVTVTIKANEQIQPVEGWELSEDKSILTKIYTQNGEEEISVYDLAGNATKQVIKITNITKKDNTIAKTILPKAGREILLIMVVVIALGILILCYKKYRSLKDVK